LQGGEVDKASQFLGRPYMLQGSIVHGESRGRALGFPTVNLKTDFDLIPPDGVYISEVALNGKIYRSVTNIGYSPTFDGQRRTIETFILDYDGDLYGNDVRLFFRMKLREEVRFENVDELRKQIGRDVSAARDYFARRSA